jgi:hypothetical protein
VTFRRQLSGVFQTFSEARGKVVESPIVDIRQHGEALSSLMTGTDKYSRIQMLHGAWSAAEALVDDKGNLTDDLKAAQAKFLRRKCCDGLIAGDCSTALFQAVEISQAAQRFCRSSCPHNSPTLSRRYELLKLLAEQLDAEFPDADPILKMAACRHLEQRWDR